MPSTVLEQFESSIPGFYHPDDVCFLGEYYCQTRKQECESAQLSMVLAATRQQKQVAEQHLPGGLVCRIAQERDTVAMAKVYRAVFASYPFPIVDPAYLKEVMGSTLFFGIWAAGELIALSSAEMDEAFGSVEITDFATLDAFRGHGFALFLLQRMEQEMAARGIHNFYTIARAYSHGMNITFARNRYTYSGTLTKNTSIFGKLESMNVWYKRWD